jgi:hypothetical protein
VNHFAKQVAFYVMGHDRRPQQVRSPRAGRIRPVAESASLLELFASALNCGLIFRRRLRSRWRYSLRPILRLTLNLTPQIPGAR